MPFIPKSWQNDPDPSTPLSAAALIDMEQRLANYVDAEIDAEGAGSLLDANEQLLAPAPTGHLYLAFGDSRVNPSLVHTKDMADRWASKLAHDFNLQLRNLGVGGSSVVGEGGDQPLPRMLAHRMGVYGPGYDYTIADTSRKPPAALYTLYDAYNTLWKWDFVDNPAFWNTVDNVYETFVRLARSDYFFPVGSGGLAAPHWTFGAGWSIGALNTNYGVGPTSRLQATGNGSFTFNPAVLGSSAWPGGDLTVIVRARKDIDNSPNWRCRIRVKIGTGSYIVTYDSTATSPKPLGVDGGAAFTSLVVPIPKGTTDTVTFDVDQIEGQCTIMGAALEVGDKADWPSPVVALALQPHLIASPNGTHPQITNASIDQINGVLSAVAARFSDGRVGIVDLPSVIDGQAVDGTRFFKDDVHHTNLGNAVIARKFAQRVAELSLSPSHARADLTSVGMPTWVSFPGDAVWDRVAHHWWVCLDDPALALGSDNRCLWVASDSPVAVEVPDAAYTLRLENMGGVVVSTASTAQTITIPLNAGIQPGTNVKVYQDNATVHFDAAAGVTLDSRGDFRTISGLHGCVTLYCVETNRYFLSGDLTDDSGSAPVFTAGEVQTLGDARWRRRGVSNAITAPIIAKQGMLLVQTTKAAQVAALTPYGFRIEVERDGFLRHIGFNVGVASGSMSAMVYDTGDAQGGAVGTRTKLWASGPIAMSGLTGGQWNTIDPGATAIPVTAGTNLDISIATSDLVSTFSRVTMPSNFMTLPTAYLPVPGGAQPKLAFRYPVLADLNAATAPATVTGGNVAGHDTLAYLSAVVL